MLNKTEEELEKDIQKEILGKHQNYHSAQRSQQNSRAGDITVLPNAVWMSLNEKRSNENNGTWK